MKFLNIYARYSKKDEPKRKLRDSIFRKKEKSTITKVSNRCIVAYCFHSSSPTPSGAMIIDLNKQVKRCHALLHSKKKKADRKKEKSITMIKGKCILIL